MLIFDEMEGNIGRNALICHVRTHVLQVNIWVPQPEKQLDVIKVTGLAANVERAKQGLLERVKELQAEQEDRVPTRVHPNEKTWFSV